MIGYAPAPTDPQRPEPGMASLRVFRFTPRALSLVWQTSPGLLVLLIALTMVAGVLPAGIAYVGARIVDAVVAAIALVQHGGHPSLALYQPVLERSEEHTSELQSLMRISYAVFCLKKKTINYKRSITYNSDTPRV